MLICVSGASLAEEGQDYGYWCNDCGRQHGPGESCPKQSAPSYSAPDEPYDFNKETVPQQQAAPQQTDAEKWKQAAEGYNKEGEELYRNGEYDKAYMKFWTAMFNDSSNPLYKENLDKAKAASKAQREELDKKIAEAHQRLSKLVISDPSVVKGHFRKEPPPPAIKRQADEAVVVVLFLTDTRPGGIFKQNPELPWINPLREPERYKAWEEEEQKRLDAEIAGYEKELFSARNRIVRNEGRTLSQQQKLFYLKALQSFKALRGKVPVTTYDELVKKQAADSAFNKSSVKIANDFIKKSDDATAKAKEEAFKKMKEEAMRYLKGHAKRSKVPN